MTAHAFAYIFPFLAAMALVQEVFKLTIKLSGNRLKKPTERPKHSEKLSLPLRAIIAGALAAVAAVFLIRLPVNGIPIAGWLLGLNTNFSIPLTSLLFSRVWQNATGCHLLDRRTLRATWIFGFTAGLTLYPPALGLSPRSMGGLDPYAYGYGSAGLSLLLLAMTIALLLKKNRFGVVLVVTMLAYDLQLQESPNLWDYLVDPVLALISVVALTMEAVTWFHDHYTPPTTPAHRPSLSRNR